MQKSQIEPAALLCAAVAASLLFLVIPGPYFYLGTIGALVVLLVLFGYDADGWRSTFQSLAFSAVCAFLATIISIPILRYVAGNTSSSENWLPAIWAVLTILLWSIDRARMGTRAAGYAQVPTGSPTPSPITASGFSPSPFSAAMATSPAVAPPPPPPSQRPAPFERSAPAEWTASVVHSEPIPPPPTRIEHPAPVPPPPPVPSPLAPPPAPPFRSTSGPELVRAPLTERVVEKAAEPEPAPSGSGPIVPSGGKLTMIYITLLGEGLNVLRSVQAEHMGRDYYRILEAMPEGETWQFQPGQVVRCEKKKLSGGKALVAVEEAPRAR